MGILSPTHNWKQEKKSTSVLMQPQAQPEQQSVNKVQKAALL